MKQMFEEIGMLQNCKFVERMESLKSKAIIQLYIYSRLPNLYFDSTYHGQLQYIIGYILDTFPIFFQLFLSLITDTIYIILDLWNRKLL